jgi:hypothetical protein
MSTSQKDDKPSDLNQGGTAVGKDKKAENDALARNDLDAALDAHERQQAALHPPTATDTANVGTASGTPNVGTASGTPNPGH